MTTRIFVGTGGVGKTSITAASALAAAMEGRKSIVLTIDPALRLRTAMGLTGAAPEQRVTLDAKGELWAALLDVPSTMERMVRADVSEREAKAITAHPIYKLMLTSLAGMNELVAMERIHHAIADGFEAIFVDTAPSRHAFEFLDKPEFFIQLVSFPLVKLVARTFGLWKMVRRDADESSRLFGSVQQLVGAALTGQVLEFFAMFQPVAQGYAKRAKNSLKLLRDPQAASFTVVSSPGRAGQDGNYFFSELTRRKFHVGQLIINRVWPALDLRLSAKTSTKTSASTRSMASWYENVCASQRASCAKASAAWVANGRRVIQLPELSSDIDGIPALMRIASEIEGAG